MIQEAKRQKDLQTQMQENQLKNREQAFSKQSRRCCPFIHKWYSLIGQGPQTRRQLNSLNRY